MTLTQELDDVSERLRARLATIAAPDNQHLKAIARKSRVSVNTVRKVRDGKANPTLSTLRAISSIIDPVPEPGEPDAHD